jgi:putative transposase
MAVNGVTCSMSRSSNVWDNAAMIASSSSLKTERTARKMYRTRNQAKADVFDYIERSYNPKRRHSTLLRRPATRSPRKTFVSIATVRYSPPN